MIGIIGIVLFWILSVALGVRFGAETVASQLYQRNRISNSEYKEFISWEYLWNKLKEGMRE